MDNRRSYIFVFFLLAALGVTGPALFVLLVDPYQIYHKSFIQPAMFSVNERYQSAGLINSYLDESYDAIIIGSSLSENFNTEQVSRVTGWKKTMRLTVNASTSEMPQEHLLVLQKALATGHIKHVLWEIHPKYIWVKDDQLDQVSEKFPEYLYNESVFDDYHYLFNDDVVKLSIKNILGQLDTLCENGCNYEWSHQWLDNFEALNQWMLREKLNEKNNGFHRFSRSAKLKAYDTKIRKNKADLDVNEILEKSRFYHSSFITERVERLIANNPDTHFNLYIPPIPSFFYAEKKNGNLIATMGLYRQIAKVGSKHKNVSFYAFNNLFQITNNVAFYKDEHHYHSDVNDYIVKRMSLDLDRVSPENFDQYALVFLSNLKTLEVQFFDKVDLNKLEPEIDKRVIGAGDNITDAEKKDWQQ
ncbi:MAG: hypothetical protein KDI30_07335 [Pseudomonadales bacterium]|nr:hypothetical protein [Pseudomonadales bacterium]